MAEPGGGVTSASWLLCRAGERSCALPLDRIAETLRPAAIEPVSGAPGFVLGLALIRGAPVPVVDLAALFGDAAAARARLVVCSVGSRRVALAVDDIPGVIATADAEPLPPLLRDATVDAVQAVRVRDGEFLRLLDSARLVSDPVLAALVAGDAPA